MDSSLNNIQVTVSVDNNMKIWRGYCIDYEFEEIGEKIIRIKIDNNHLIVGYESGMLRRIELNNYEIVFESKEEGMVLNVMVLDVIIGG